MTQKIKVETDMEINSELNVQNQTAILKWIWYTWQNAKLARQEYFVRQLIAPFQT